MERSEPVRTEKQGRIENSGFCSVQGGRELRPLLSIFLVTGYAPGWCPGRRGGRYPGQRSSCLPGIQDRGQLDFVLWGLLFYFSNLLRKGLRALGDHKSSISQTFILHSLGQSILVWETDILRPYFLTLQLGHAICIGFFQIPDLSI